MSAVAVADQIAGKAACLANPKISLGPVLSPVDRGLFAGVADWPHIGEIFTARSLNILASGGICAWCGAGGRRGYDGRLGFGAVSSPALEIIRELADTSGGFRWTDDAGSTWAVRFADDQGHDPDRSAVAASYRGCLSAIDARRRRPALQALETQVARCGQPARSWDDADRVRFGRLRRMLYNLRLVDSAERIIDHLQHYVGGERATHVLLSADELGVVLNPIDEKARPSPTVNELAAMLRATMGFEIARLQLGSLGWDPRVVCQSAAVTEVDQVGPETFRVRISPLFSEVVAAFAGVTSPQQARRCVRRTMWLVESPTILIS